MLGFFNKGQDQEKLSEVEREAQQFIERHRLRREPVSGSLSTLVGAMLIADAINGLASALRETGGAPAARPSEPADDPQ